MTGRVLALCGGIGGAKLALGLYHVLPPQKLVVAVNTGDDFSHLGLHISPDLDTVLYTLAGVADSERGWGRADERWLFMNTLGELGGDTWFRIGDRDLAVHVERTRLLREGQTLSAVTERLTRAFNVHAQILPMSDDLIQTIVVTEEGSLTFQRYFVERRCSPAVRSIRFRGAEQAVPVTELFETIGAPDLAAIVICPSNPFLSIDPILSVPGVRSALARAEAPVLAVSPIIRREAVKGPTVKIMKELGIPASNRAIAAHYGEIIDGLVIDEADADDAADIRGPVLATPTLMESLDDRIQLAAKVLAFAGSMRVAGVQLL
jgi:LPPG:FO 2-phospho-L-lactate transferase